MDIRKWLAENTKTRRNKAALMLGLVLFPLVLMVGLYLLYLNIENLQTTMHDDVSALSFQKSLVIRRSTRSLPIRASCMNGIMYR